MAKVSGSNKKMLGSVRAKAGMVAKAGKRRPPHIMKDARGNYVTGQVAQAAAKRDAK